jgi:hypothetical protein
MHSTIAMSWLLHAIYHSFAYPSTLTTNITSRTCFTNVVTIVIHDTCYLHLSSISYTKYTTSWQSVVDSTATAIIKVQGICAVVAMRTYLWESWTIPTHLGIIINFANFILHYKLLSNWGNLAPLLFRAISCISV